MSSPFIFQQKPTTLADLMGRAPIQTPDQQAMSERPLDVVPGGPTAEGISALLPQLPKPKAFGQGGKGWQIIGIIGDALSAVGGGEPTYLNTMMQRQQDDQKARQRLQELMFQRETKLAELNRPQYFMSGRDRVSFDPTTGESGVVYQGTPDFQEYANSLGYEPGSNEYNQAMQDFVLRSYGPTAQQGKIGLEGVRQKNRVTLRQTPTYANTHPRPTSGGGGGNPPRNTGNVYGPILAKVAAGQQLSPGEQALYNIYSRNRGGARGSSSGATTAPQTATDPKTGKKVQWNGSQWVPLN